MLINRREKAAIRRDAERQRQPGQPIPRAGKVMAHIHMPHHIAFAALHAALADHDHGITPGNRPQNTLPRPHKQDMTP